MRTHDRIVALATLVLAAGVGACAASNPTRTNEPAPWEPKPKSEAVTTNKPKASDAPAPAATNSADGAKTDPSKPVAAATGADAQQEKAASGASPGDPGAAAAAAGTSAKDKNATEKTAPEKTAAEQTAPEKTAADKTTKPAGTSEPIVARVADDPIYVSELFEQALYSEPLEMFDHVEAAVMGRLVMAEAKRLRVRLDPALDTSGYEEAVKAAEARYAKQFPNMPLDRFVGRVLGLDPIKFRDHLRENSRKTLFASRVARAWLLQQEHADIHVIVVGSEDEIKAAQKDLADGVAFEDVARKRSADPSKDKGGQVASMVRKNTPLGKLAFETPPGKVGGPLTDHGAWLLVRVDAVHAPLEGDWSRIGSAVEQSLKEREVDSIEIRQWRDAMVERYTVEVSPFLDLVGDTDH